MSQGKTELVETLLEAGVFKYDEVVEAAQFPGGGSLVEKALTLGFGNENDVLKIISNRMNLAVAEDDVLSVINPEVLQNLPKDVMIRHHILPFFSDNATLNIAMIDPTDDGCLNEIAFFTELKLLPYGVLASKLTKALNSFFGMGLPETFIHRSTRNNAAPAAPTAAAGNMPPPRPPQPMSVASQPSMPPKPNMPDARVAPPLPSGTPSRPPMPGMPGMQKPVAMPAKPTSVPAAPVSEDMKTVIENVTPAAAKPSPTPVNDEKSVIVDALKQQKEALEEDFNKRLEDMKKRFAKLEKDKKIDKLKEELEERLDIKRTMDKLNEMERMRYMQGPGQQQYFAPPYGQYQPPPQQQPIIIEQQKPEPDKNNEIATVLSKQIDELKQQIMELSKIAMEKASVAATAATATATAPVPPPIMPAAQPQTVEPPKPADLPDIDHIVEDMNAEPIVAAPKEITVDIAGILNAKDKDAVLNAVISEMRKISKRTVILFIKYENLVGVSGFGQYVEERVQNYSTTIILPGMFKKIYDSKKPIHGQLELTEMTKKFLDYFGAIRPEKMTLVPAILKNRVFAMIYAEEVDNLNNVVKIAESMSESFSNLLSQR